MKRAGNESPAGEKKDPPLNIRTLGRILSTLQSRGEIFSVLLHSSFALAISMMNISFKETCRTLRQHAVILRKKNYTHMQCSFFRERACYRVTENCTWNWNRARKYRERLARDSEKKKANAANRSRVNMRVAVDFLIRIPSLVITHCRW